MTYTIKNSDWQWIIVPEPDSNRYMLKCKRPTEWTDCRAFDTPESAAKAVAQGKTGQKEWDEAKRDDSSQTSPRGWSTRQGLSRRPQGGDPARPLAPRLPAPGKKGLGWIPAGAQWPLK